MTGGQDTSFKREEAWKAIPGYEDAYEVSDAGRVRSLDRTIYVEIEGRGVVAKRLRGRVLKAQPTSRGYMQVALSGTFYLVRALVLMAFEGPRPEGYEIISIDKARANNKLSNLKYAIPPGSDNAAQGRRLQVARAGKLHDY